MILDVTGDELAASLGCSRAAITLWEQGLRTPSEEMRVKIAKLLKTTPADLWPALYHPEATPDA